MDLNDIVATERSIEITHPGTGEEIGLNITLVSLNDDKTKALKRKFHDEDLALQRRGKFAKAEDIEDRRTRLCFAAMLGWDWHGTTFNKQKPDFNLKNVKEVLTNFPWIKTQVEEAVSDEQSFFQS